MPRPGATHDDTTNGHRQWTARVMKERAVNTVVSKDGFSAAACVRNQDVPLRFKPTQDGPSHVDGVSRDVQVALDNRRASPRQLYFWPETAQQDVGWLSAGSPVSARKVATERVVLSGRMPSCNVGWSASTPRTDGLNPSPQQPSQQQPSSSLQNRGSCAASVAKHRSPASVPPTPRIRSEVPIVRTESATAQETPRKTQTGQHSSIPGPFPGSTSTETSPPSDPWGQCGFDSPRRRGGPPPNSCEEGVRAAVQNGRRFLNQPGNKWYRPKGSSDVVQFGDAYVRSFGKSLFA
eukprot:TRINITY_DN32570_c0_g1_i1.p1 TRINITY_DN32570_c0_g1~~TRINITY_DN32570_c0_g1_i1.p1  ORF type:complete len:293 (+),score=38.80 TRINITY_DN32570_c0_g1_i1:66-944(+)